MKRRPAWSPPASSNPTSAPQPALEVGVGAPARLARLLARVDDLGHLLLPGEPVGHLLRVLAMLAHAQRQRLQPLDEHEGVERRHRRADVAQQRDARLDDVGDRAQRLHRLGPHRAVIAGVGLVQHREAVGVLLPVEIAAIDDDAADRGAVPADILGGRMHDDGRAVLERPAQHRRGRVVHDQRHAAVAPDLRHLGDREDGELRVGQRLGVIAARLRVGRAGEVLRVGGIDEAASRCPSSSACCRTGSRCRHRCRSS